MRRLHPLLRSLSSPEDCLMSFFSLSRRLSRCFRGQACTKKRRPRLSLETLESRDLLASGPSVVAVTPITPQSPPLTTLTVTFNANDPVDPSTFTLASNEQARNNV